MSGECELCGNHALECICKNKIIIYPDYDKVDRLLDKLNEDLEQVEDLRIIDINFALLAFLIHKNITHDITKESFMINCERMWDDFSYKML